MTNTIQAKWHYDTDTSESWLSWTAGNWTSEDIRPFARALITPVLAPNGGTWYVWEATCDASSKRGWTYVRDDAESACTAALRALAMRLWGAELDML